MLPQSQALKVLVADKRQGKHETDRNHPQGQAGTQHGRGEPHRKVRVTRPLRAEPQGPAEVKSLAPISVNRAIEWT
jgi:hypothetical protein